MTTPDKWHWMMDYCRKRRLPPAQEWAWKLAENAYNELVEKCG